MSEHAVDQDVNLENEDEELARRLLENSRIEADAARALRETSQTVNAALKQPPHSASLPSAQADGPDRAEAEMDGTSEQFRAVRGARRLEQGASTVGISPRRADLQADGIGVAAPLSMNSSDTAGVTGELARSLQGTPRGEDKERGVDSSATNTSHAPMDAHAPSAAGPYTAGNHGGDVDGRAEGGMGAAGSMEESGGGGGEEGLAEGVGLAAKVRYQAARMQVLQEQVAQLREQLALRSEEAAAASAAAKEAGAMRAKSERVEKSLRAALEKEKEKAEEKAARAEALERELATVRDARAGGFGSGEGRRRKDVAGGVGRGACGGLCGTRVIAPSLQFHSQPSPCSDPCLSYFAS
eukprot:6204357-Pleurochrysis_carterae.AAC.1